MESTYWFRIMESQNRARRCFDGQNRVTMAAKILANIFIGDIAEMRGGFFCCVEVKLGD
jgi:hypothetical protein